MAKAWNGFSKLTAQRSVLFRSNAVVTSVARSSITFAVGPEKQHESKRKFIDKTYDFKRGQGPFFAKLYRRVTATPRNGF
jgi:hypothetical protein